MKTIEVHSSEDTKRIAEQLAQHLEAGMLITLSGDLGAGKTTFTKYLGAALGVKKTINSPTFTILKVYQGRCPLYHIDAYRLEGCEQDLGFEEYYDGDGICIVEWPMYVEEQLPKERLSIEIIFVKEEERIFHISARGTRYEKLLEDLA